MALEETRAWIMLLVTIVSYTAYLAAVLGRPGDTPLAQVPYVSALLWTVGAAIVASIVLNIAVAIVSPKEANAKDQRDREIHRFGEYVGQSFVVIGGVAGLVMAMADIDRFWIANAIYLAFALSAILGSTAKIVAYRLGFHPW
ncbi:hypothetical protein GCM10010193_15350 [Kitasatospora atroaurantiaca]|uniref:Uncharacterized protein n=1 Tax=Kitasatospora atroaurantiaca TaxID=285545 RepID=A0A561EIM4_9ACTN|nr:hypothetical protein [Kitasatospora atroaurantiaca]TWE15422.1 hypothetical protein FB465_0315 [Kitasatospora atroaurantiaca]